MKRQLDELFTKFLKSKKGYVVTSDVGNFPSARKQSNFIDLGSSEACSGSIIDGMLLAGNDVWMYDICGYVLRNSYAGLHLRKSRFEKNRGRLVIFGWGSGFSYDGCGMGHYPFDDITIASLCGLLIVNPRCDESIESILNKYDCDLYIRLYDTTVYHDTPIIQADNPHYQIVSYGWLYYALKEHFSTYPPEVQKNIDFCYYEECDNDNTYFEIFTFNDQYIEYVEGTKTFKPQIDREFTKESYIAGCKKILDKIIEICCE